MKLYKDNIYDTIGSQIHDPHLEQFLDITQTQYFIKFQEMYPQTKISQRYFEMVKPFYVKIIHTCTTLFL